MPNFYLAHHDLITAIIAVHWLTGIVLAGLMFLKRRSLVRFLEGPKARHRSREAAAKASLSYVRGFAWMMATGLSSALCIPILPAYTAFKWMDSFWRGFEFMTGVSLDDR